MRQKVEHKRTFLYLEQLILKHGMEANTIGIKSQPDGLDFYYGSRSHGLKMVRRSFGVFWAKSREGGVGGWWVVRAQAHTRVHRL